MRPLARPYLQHGSRHAPRGSDPIPQSSNEWCLAKATGSVPGTNAATLFNVELAFGSGVDSGLYTQNTDPSFDTVQINDSGTYRVQSTAQWIGVIGAPSEGQLLLAKAVIGSGINTEHFGFGGLPVAGGELLRASGTDYSDKLSSSGFLHWPTNTDTPATFGASLVGMTANQNTGSSLDLSLWIYVERVDLYMLDEEVALAWLP